MLASYDNELSPNVVQLSLHRTVTFSMRLNRMPYCDVYGAVRCDEFQNSNLELPRNDKSRPSRKLHESCCLCLSNHPGVAHELPEKQHD